MQRSVSEARARMETKNDSDHEQEGEYKSRTNVTSAVVGDARADLRMRKYVDNLLRNQITGQERVRQMLKMIVSQVETQKLRALRQSQKTAGVGAYNVREDSMYHHMIMKGPLAVGKFTVAALHARILYRLGVLKKKVFIHVRNTTLKKFSKLIEVASAREQEDPQSGPIAFFFVEESSDLFENPKDKDVLDFFEKVLKAQDVICCFSGPTKEMDSFIQSFPSLVQYIRFRLTFDSLNIEEMIEVFARLCRAQNQILEQGGLKPIRAMLKHIPKQVRRERNVRILREVLTQAKFVRDARINSMKASERPDLLNVVLVEDITRALMLLGYKFEADDERTVDELLEDEFKKIVGCPKVKEHVQKLVNSAKMHQLRMQRGLTRNKKQRYHCIFSGPPGTGKTMFAKLLAKVLLKLELVPSDILREVPKGGDLKGTHMGKTGPKVDALVASAKGGVIFVDEAYTVGTDDFGKEAVESVMKHLDPPSAVFILAGYRNEMDEWLQINPGLTRRIPYRFDFVPYKTDELISILQIHCKIRSQTVAEEEYKGIKTLLMRIPKRKVHNQNAGLIVNWLNEAMNQRDDRLTSMPFEEVAADETLLRSLIAEDFENAMYVLKYAFKPGADDGMSVEEYMEKEFSKLVGLTKVKEMMRRFARRVAMDRLLEEKTGNKQGDDKEMYHMVFSGNPGTGKSHMARLVSQLMLRLQLIQSDRIVEVKNGLELIGRYMGETPAKVDRRVEEAAGGVVFIDEAYSLSDGMGDGGGAQSAGGANYHKEAIDTIMKHMNPPQALFIFAGYEQEMRRFLRGNPGLARRAPYQFHFPDYTVPELVEIFHIVATKKHGFVYDKEAMTKELSTVLSQIHKNEVAKHNAGLVTQTLSVCSTIIRARLTLEEVSQNPDAVKTLTVRDVKDALVQLGFIYSPEGELDEKETLEEWMEKKFKKIIGSNHIKDHLRKLAKSVKMNMLRAEHKGGGVSMQSQRFHMVFAGPPGTGKTMWAKIVARMLRMMKVVPTEQVVWVKNPLELQGQYQGQTGPKVDTRIKEAKGGVIFIDEAYSLMDISAHGAQASSYAKEVIDTIMKHMDPPSAVFIFAGYKQPMEDFLRANEGLKRRTPYHFEFKPYSVDELVDIFFVMCQAKGETLVVDGQEKPKEIVRRLIQSLPQRAILNRNGGLCESLLAQSKIERDTELDYKTAKENPEVMSQLRVRHLKKALKAMNFKIASDEMDEKALDEWLERELRKVVGCKPIKDQIWAFRRKVQLDRLRRKQGIKVKQQPYHMIFSGPPGCGKTMIAKLLARVMVRLRLIASDDVVHVGNPNDLVGMYLGQTAPKVDRVVDSANGGVLFIDEAYSLNPTGMGDTYKKEAIDTLMKHLDPPSCVVIFAGYERPMDQFLKANPGLERRIPYRYRFTPYGPRELMAILRIMCQIQGQELPEKDLPTIQKVLLANTTEEYRKVNNGGLIRNWLNFAKNYRDSIIDMDDYHRNPKALNQLSARHFAQTVHRLQSTRRVDNVVGMNRLDDGDSKAPSRGPQPAIGGGQRFGQSQSQGSHTGGKNGPTEDSVELVLRDMFRSVDKQKDGAMEPREMKKVYDRFAQAKLVSDKLSRSRQNLLNDYTRMDSDGDWTVSEQEFVDFYVNHALKQDEYSAFWERDLSSVRQELGLPAFQGKKSINKLFGSENNDDDLY